MTKFLIIGDLHGKKPKIYYKNFDAIIAPGDFCSDALRKLHSPDSKIEWFNIIGKRKTKKMIIKSISDGRKILKFLNSFEVPVFIVPGNWDWTKHNSKWVFERKDHFKSLIKGLENIVNVYHRIIDVNGYQIIGHGIHAGPEYPQYKQDLRWIKPNRLKEMKNKYKKELKKLSSLFKKSKMPVIFLSHNVPFRTSLDKIVNKKSPAYGKHFGSVIAKEMIKQHQPLVFIGAHMHEHFGKIKIGKTVAINAGFGPNVNILLELKENKIKNLKFHKRKL